MDKIVNLPSLISLVSAQTGIDSVIVRRFIHDFFTTIESELVSGESVTIDGLGQFAFSDNSATPVVFKVDERLAALVNEPFSVFKPVVLNDGAEKEIVGNKTPEEINAVLPNLPHLEEADVPSHMSRPAIEVMPSPIPEQEGVVVDHNASSLETETKAEVKTEAETEVFVNNRQTPEDTPQPVAPVDMPPVYEQSQEPLSVMPANNTAQSSRILWLILGLMGGIIIGLVAGYFAGKSMAKLELPDEFYEYYAPEVPIEDNSVESMQVTTSTTENKAAEDDSSAENIKETENSDKPTVIDSEIKRTPSGNTDNSGNELGRSDQKKQNANTVTSYKSVKNLPTKSVGTPVYDTVTPRRFLATMARNHYGERNYWVFIYAANPKLGNPNHISPGTRVVIPPYESFAESTADATAAKAQRLLNELSKKYPL